ncbi:MAG: hypothetical protein KFF73_07180 [Cyclobacteriaceae bacterium]|jgi:hypothetical protein|nr:hypothetical protein [Cyclobacteriaceae bacterium]
MKKHILLPFMILLAFFQVNAQCDNPFYQFKEGTLMETENFDEKGKSQGKTEIRVIRWDETGSGYVATLGYKFYDKKGNLGHEGDYTMECKDGIISIDMSAFIPDESMEAFKDMEMEMKMDQLEFPADLKVGQELKDAKFEMTAKGPMPMNFVFLFTDRKVEDRESVTTPAGTFDCFKISQTTNSKMMIANSEFKTIQYLAEKYGAVKSETYRSNGKMVGYSLLTRFED